MIDFTEDASGKRNESANGLNFDALPDPPDWMNDLSRGPKVHFTDAETSDKKSKEGGQRIPEGRRNATLTSLAGTMRKRGMSSDEILAAISAVNTNRCDPPLADHEVEAIARNIGAKPAGGAGSSHFRSTYRAWPELGEEALYGVAGDLVRAIEPHTEADPVAVLLQILVGFGNKIGRKSFFQVESAKHYLNEYVVLVGETSKGRKGTSWSIVSSVLEDVDSAWATECVQSGLSSGEGLIWAVRDAIKQHTPVKEKGRVVDYEDVVIDPGVTDKRLLVVEAEFANTLKMMQREGNVLSPTIRAAWDSGDLRTLTKNSHAVATGAHVSIIGHITIDELLRYLSSTEAGNGYANRHLFILVRRSKLLPDGGNLSIKDLAPLIQRLKSAAAFAEQDQEFTRDIEARELWRTVYEQLSTGKPGLYGAVTSRSEAHAVRYSAIYAALDCSTTIRREHLLAALAIVRYGDESVRHIFGDSLGDSVADDILQALRAAQPDGLTRTELSDVFKGHQRKGNIDRALQLLLGHGLVRVEKQHTDGRPAEVWYATKSEDVRDGARG